MDEAVAQEVGDLIRKGDMWTKGNARIAHRRVEGESERCTFSTLAQILVLGTWMAI